MSEPSVFIIIVNWKNWQDTLECLESLRGIDNDNFKTIVVDNCSENESFEKISIWCEEKGRFSTIKTESNLGFAGGCNIGIRHALSKKADYILLLNNDTIAEPDFLGRMVETSKQSPHAGIIGGKIFQNNSNKLWFLGGKMSWLRGGGYHPGKNKPDAYKKKGPFEVDFITGCLMLIRATTIEKIGLLDESYFLYNEDADYCLRAKKAGIRMIVVPSSIIYHKENSTIRGWMPYHIYYLIRNKLFFVKRHSPNPAILTLFYFIIACIGILLSTKWLIQGRIDLIRAFKKAIADYRQNIRGASFNSNG